MMPPFAGEIVNRQDIGMGERRYGLGLSLEAPSGRWQAVEAFYLYDKHKKKKEKKREHQER